jgi:hypothetical protein
MYRLFIDYPINASSTEEAVVIARKICETVISEEIKESISAVGIEQINYRLGHDEDRQNRNYFVITDSGHASTKKTRVFLQPSSDTSV